MTRTSVQKQQGRYWVVKGNKKFILIDERDGDIDQMFDDAVGQASHWYSKKKLRDEVKAMDKVFFWSSSPDLFIIALGHIKEVYEPEPKYCAFDVVPTVIIPKNHRKSFGSEGLKKCFPHDARPTFLRPAIIETVYPLSEELDEAGKIYAFMSSVAKGISGKDGPILSRKLDNWWREPPRG